jgi:hypothetical protein
MSDLSYFAYRFSLLGAPPPSQQLRLNSSDATTATVISAHYITTDVHDVYYGLANLTPGLTLYLQDANDHTLVAQYVIAAAVIDQGTYFDIPVSYVQGSGIIFQNNQNVLLAVRQSAVSPHAPTHQAGGSDALALDALAPPTDVTTLNASTSAHGLLPKLPGDPTKYLDGSGAFSVPTSAPASGGGLSTFVSTPWMMPQAVASVLVMRPTEEPLTLDEAKLRAGLDWVPGDPRDALMRGFIAAARAQVELDTGLALLTQTRKVTTAASPYQPIPWQAWPVQSMTQTATGAPVPPAAYNDFGAWSQIWIPGGTWTVVAGWPTAADLLADAPLLVHAVGLLTAHYATIGRDLAFSERRVELVPMGYEEAIAPYRLMVLT